MIRLVSNRRGEGASPNETGDQDLTAVVRKLPARHDELSRLELVDLGPLPVQTRAVPSNAIVTRWFPSGLNAMLRTSPVCP